MRVGGAHRPARLLVSIPRPGRLSAQGLGGRLTYVLAPGEGQGWGDGSCLLLAGWWLVTVVPGLLSGQHVHL